LTKTFREISPSLASRCNSSTTIESNLKVMLFVFLGFILSSGLDDSNYISL